MAGWSEQAQAQALQQYVVQLAKKSDFGAEDALAIARAANMYRVEHLATAVVNQLGSGVLSGTFKGMKLVPVQMGSLLMPKILGTYESEIAPVFRDMARFGRLIDVGSAEGFYAVGCPFVHRHLRSIAYDVNERAQEVCARAAALNGVSDRVDQRGFCSPEELASLATPDSLILIDIDGAETDLLCAIPATRLARSEILLEVHQQGTATTAIDIIPHFSDTHEITMIRQGVVDPGQFEFLRQLSSFERFLTVWEGRKTEAWLHMKPRG